LLQIIISLANESIYMRIDNKTEKNSFTLQKGLIRPN